MIFVDDRTGSKHLLQPLRSLGLDAQLTRLDFGDVSFEGKGPNGTMLTIGVELKRLTDLISSIRTGRLSGHQLPGLIGPQGAYDYAWLVVEGYWRTNQYDQIALYHGRVRGWQVVPGRMTASELEKRLLTYELCGRLHVRLTNRSEETTHFISSLYRWWTDKAMDAHIGHLDHHRVGGVVPLSDFRQAVIAWPGVGRAVSLSAELTFRSIRRAATGSVDAWANLATLDTKGNARRFGIAAAERLVDWLKKER